MNMPPAAPAPPPPPTVVHQDPLSPFLADRIKQWVGHMETAFDLREVTASSHKYSLAIAQLPATATAELEHVMLSAATAADPWGDLVTELRRLYQLDLSARL